MRRVVVVGHGVAGTAAALAAARGGAEVTVVAGGTGASVLAGGALDDEAWEEAAAGEAPAPMAAGTRYVLDALGGYSVGEARALVVATTGVVRSARGIDRALLDVSSLARATVMVADVAHGSWDAHALARAWSAPARVRAAGVRFVPIAAGLFARTEEHAFGDADLAASHDHPARLASLGDRLREARGRDVGAVVLPPWLGVSEERATELSARVGVPCGEALGGVGGPSGLRFEHSRDRALRRAGVTVLVGRATAVRAASSGYCVEVTGGSPTGEPLACDAVVLATGGLIGGGLDYTPSGAYLAKALPEAPRPLLRVTCDAPVRIGASGRPLDDPSSLFGGPPEAHAWPYGESPLLERAGVLVDDVGRVMGAPAGLYAAGEVAAAAPRTWLVALASGARAGERAAAARG